MKNPVGQCTRRHTLGVLGDPLLLPRSKPNFVPGLYHFFRGILRYSFSNRWTLNGDPLNRGSHKRLTRYAANHHLLAASIVVMKGDS